MLGPMPCAVLPEAELPMGLSHCRRNAASMQSAPAVGLFMQQLWLIVGDCR